MPRRFEGDRLRALAVPLGGLGTGHVALCGDGALRQWQLANSANHTGFVPGSFFALRATSAASTVDCCRTLRRRPLPPPASPAPGMTDHLVPDRAHPPVWPYVPDTTAEVGYPFVRIRYGDEALPVTVELEAYTPFVPADVAASSLPLAAYRFRLGNPGPVRMHGFLVASLQNSVGWDGLTPIRGTAGTRYGGNVNRTVRRGDTTTILMDNPSLAEDDPAAGELVLSSDAPAVAFPRTTDPADVLRAVESLALMRCVNTGDWSATGVRAAVAAMRTARRDPIGPSPAGRTFNGALALAWSLAPGESTDLEVVHAWRFPNRTVTFEQFHAPDARSVLWLGNRYAERFGTALDVADHYAGQRDELRAASRAWAGALHDASLPREVIEVLDAQPALVRSPTVFRTADGNVFGHEGVLGRSTRNWAGDAGGSCPVNCTHVWNYEQALSRLFPALERRMRDVDLDVAQAPDGSVPHRILLPLWADQHRRARIGGPDAPALDGMLGTVLKTYREARQGAGADWLHGRWPALRALMEHVERTWHRTGDGLLTGAQPVTYDMALTGANMVVGGLWLAALRTMQVVAGRVGADGAAHYADLYATAARRYDEALWNGDWWAQEPSGADHEIGPGCLSDQLLGQWWAHQLGLGHLLPPDRIRGALRAIVRHNLRDGGWADCGPRSFADGADTGLLNCTWPTGGRPAVPVLYADEVWTGTEYQVAAHCLWEGLDAEATRVLAGALARHDGSRRNPYNQVECGDHYARAMSGWSLLEAASGTSYDALDATLTYRPRPGRYPVLAGSGWGVLTVDDASAELHHRHGHLNVRALVRSPHPATVADS